MLEDWKKLDVVEAWVKANGSDSAPFGDPWRVCLINPVVFEIFKLIYSGDSEIKTLLPLSKGLAKQRRAPGIRYNVHTEYVRWHLKGSFDPDGSPAPILDLGCGEAYLGRWLSALGAYYVGLDGSPELMKIARQRREGLEQNARQRILLREQDLEADDLDFSRVWEEITSEISEGEEPCISNPGLVVINIVLEHLKDPGNLCRKLSRWLSTFQVTPGVLVFTANPWAYGVSPRRTSQLNEEPHIFSIASANATVRSIIRSPDDWEMIFRVAGLNVLACESLYFHDVGVAGEALVEMDEGKVNLGTPPFFAWFLTATNRGQDLSKKELRELLLNEPLISTGLSDGERAVLLERFKKLRVVEFGVGEKICYVGNLGTQCYFVLGGKAEVTVDGNLSLEFFPGDLFGELEVVDNHHLGRYAVDVRAGASGCKVLSVPREVFEDIIAHLGANSFAYKLFKNLRDRILRLVHLTRKDRGRGITLTSKFTKSGTEPIQLGKNVSDRTVSLAAQSLTAAMYHQTAIGLPEMEDVLFCPIERVPLFVGAEKFGRPVDSFKVLSAAGLITFMNARQARGKNLSALVKAWKDICRASVDHLVKPDFIELGIPVSEELPGELVGVFVKEDDTVSQSYFLSPETTASEKPRALKSTLRREFIDEKNRIGTMLRNRFKDVSSSEYFRSEIYRIVDTWCSNVIFAHENFFVGGTNFIVINDAMLLRYIANDVTGWTRALEYRLLACNNQRTNIAESNPASWSNEWEVDEYAKRFALFCETSWSTLKNISFSVPENDTRQGEVSNALQYETFLSRGRSSVL